MESALRSEARDRATTFYNIKYACRSPRAGLSRDFPKHSQRLFASLVPGDRRLFTPAQLHPP